MSRDFLLIFELRPHLFVVLELSLFLTFRAFYGFEYFGEILPSSLNFLVDELVLVETQKNPYCASWNAKLFSSVCRCSSPMHLLRDST